MNHLNQTTDKTIENDFLKFACRTIELKSSITRRQSSLYTYENLAEFENEFASPYPLPWKLVLCNDTRTAPHLDALLTKVSDANTSDHLDAPFRYSHVGEVSHHGACYLWTTSECFGEIIISIKKKGGG